MLAYTKPQQRKKEESGMLRGERDQIKFIDLGLTNAGLKVLHDLPKWGNH